MTSKQLVARAGTVHWQEIGIENRKHVSLTRMHSSRMRTDRLLTVSRSIQGSCLPTGGVCLGSVCPGVSAQGVSTGRGCLASGVSAPLHADIHIPPL